MRASWQTRTPSYRHDGNCNALHPDEARKRVQVRSREGGRCLVRSVRRGRLLGTQNLDEERGSIQSTVLPILFTVIRIFAYQLAYNLKI